MYPYVRLYAQILKWRTKPLAPWDTHVSHHRVLPWDIDHMRELNNGLTLTFYDMGRIPFVVRTGTWDTFRSNNLLFTIAGSALLPCSEHSHR